MAQTDLILTCRLAWWLKPSIWTLARLTKLGARIPENWIGWIAAKAVRVEMK